MNLKKENQFWKNRFRQAQTSYNDLEKELKNRNSKQAKVAKHSDDSIEVIESEQVTIEDVADEDGEQFTEQIVANKLRGFRRTDPSKPAEQQKSSLKKSVSFASVTANGSATSGSPLESPGISKQTKRIL